jgi:hypothetical protein
LGYFCATRLNSNKQETPPHILPPRRSVAVHVTLDVNFLTDRLIDCCQQLRRRMNAKSYAPLHQPNCQMRIQIGRKAVACVGHMHNMNKINGWEKKRVKYMLFDFRKKMNTNVFNWILLSMYVNKTKHLSKSRCNII